MKLSLSICLLILLFSCSKKEAPTMMEDATEVKDKVLETPLGEIEVCEGSIEQFEQQIRPLINAENDFIIKADQKLSPFVYKYTKKKLAKSVTDLKILDESFTNWLNSTDKNKESNEDIVQILGTALGQYLISELKMQWVIVNDKYGTDWAVQHKPSEVLAFPHSSVLKRIESKESGFIESIFYILQKSIKEKNTP